MSTYLGIDIGGTNIVYGIVDDDNGLKYQSSVKTKNMDTPAMLAETIYQDIKTNFRGNINGIGIGAPSVNCDLQQIEFAPNLNKWGDIIPLGNIFESKFSQPTYLVNDANAAAIGEKHFGDAQQSENFAVITLGTGVGMGIYINGKLYTGDHAMAGEIGHLIVHRDGRECKCGNNGCLEAYAGKKGIIRTAKEKLEFSSGGSLLHALSPSTLTPLEIFKAAKKDDPVSLEVVDSVAHDLGYALGALANLFDFENIYLTGGIAKSGNFLRKRIEKYLRLYTLPNIRDKVKLKNSEINEKHGAVLGAVAAVKNHLVNS